MVTGEILPVIERISVLRTSLLAYIRKHHQLLRDRRRSQENLELLGYKGEHITPWLRGGTYNSLIIREYHRLLTDNCRSEVNPQPITHWLQRGHQQLYLHRLSPSVSLWAEILWRAPLLCMSQIRVRRVNDEWVTKGRNGEGLSLRNATQVREN